MLKEAVRYAWRILPGSLRKSVTRLAQQKFTVSAAVVTLNARKEVLLLNHVLRPYSGWGLPGGFVDRGEQPENAIRREIREETGIELDDLRMIEVRVLGAHVEMMFAATTTGDPTVRSREIIGLGWFDVDGVPEDFSHSQQHLIKKVLNGEFDK
ncbi:MAG: NUDIX hydrolase [Acidobacteriota bacterium]